MRSLKPKIETPDIPRTTEVFIGVAMLSPRSDINSASGGGGVSAPRTSSAMYQLIILPLASV